MRSSEGWSPLDSLVLLYAVLVSIFICYFHLHSPESNDSRKKKHKFKFSRVPPARKLSSVAKSNKDWKKEFEGVWLQYKEENFDEFLKFSGTSFALRKVIPVAFYMTRHTLSITKKQREGSDGFDEYFTVKRDFGENVREWTLTMKIGKDQSSAEPVQSAIDTDEMYIFQNWANDEEQSISTLSTPLAKGIGVRCVQTRTLLNPNEIRMTYDGYNLKTKEFCEMVSYFKRV